MTDREKEKLCLEVTKLRDKAMAFTRKHFSLTEMECEDVCQDAFEIFYKDIRKSGFELTSTLSSFFIGICNNKAREELRKKGRMPNDESAVVKINEDRFDMNRVDQILAIDNEPSYENQRNSLVEKIVLDLPHPCNKLLWGQYWDSFSMSVLATICGYKNADVAKSKLSQCRKKFEMRYEKECSSLH